MKEEKLGKEAESSYWVGKAADGFALVTFLIAETQCLTPTDWRFILAHSSRSFIPWVVNWLQRRNRTMGGPCGRNMLMLSWPGIRERREDQEER